MPTVSKQNSLFFMYLPILPISLGSPSLIAVSYSGNLNPLPLKPRASPFSSISLSPTFILSLYFLLSSAMKWPPDGTPAQDLHDFRSSAWFVEAATSPKDIVILLDASSTLSSKHRNLARATIHVILDTLGPNDFVNIFTFSDVTVELVSCYK